ncbi:MAG TPA: hypothetical protein DEF18_14220 [Muricauda sp.]|nr:hypothetical protein [Allomuricauda sp.]|tara:strand:- start:2379 stop:3020 length:642 start_codon:yes stop_codon:yes gene_type:complete
MSKKKLRPCGQDFSCLFLSALKTYKSLLKPKLKSQMKNIFNQKVVLSFLLLFSLTLTTSLAQTEDVVIVDSDFSNKGGLIASLPINVALIETKMSNNLAQTFKQALAENPNVKNIHLFAPSTDASINLDGQPYNAETIAKQFHPTDFQTHNPITVFVYSCSLAKNALGISLLETISSRTGFNVASCASCDDLKDELMFDYSVRPLTATSNLFE